MSITTAFGLRVGRRIHQVTTPSHLVQDDERGTIDRPETKYQRMLRIPGDVENSLAVLAITLFGSGGLRYYSMTDVLLAAERRQRVRVPSVRLARRPARGRHEEATCPTSRRSQPPGPRPSPPR